MSAKVITLNLPLALLEKLAGCLRGYADAAYPPGASECAQVARATLMDAAQSIEHQLHTREPGAEVSRRLRSQFKAAIEYCRNENLCGMSENEASQIYDALQGNKH